MSARSINPELLDEFTPESIAEADAFVERVMRKAALRKPAGSAAHGSEPGASANQTGSCASSIRDADSEQRTPVISGAVSTAQLHANRANSKLSTGARTAAGKETVSFNAFRHGLTGRFKIMPYESEHDYEALLDGLRDEHSPSTPTEHLLIDRMAQHYWLSQRAQYLQDFCFNEAGGCDSDAHLALYLRYQTTHERAFHKCLNDLLKLRSERRKEQIGFVSQQQKAADQTRREAREKRQQERHQWAMLMHSAKLSKQQGRISDVGGADDRFLSPAETGQTSA